ncbi:MAG TPA: zf-HC2 domain-containing protein [Bryobacteraceae bacterium]|nr:zf-HC2 domain-containing protein [Bryobacteraceae bacterium]
MKRLSDSCRHFDRHQSAYVDGELPAAVRQQVQSHLAFCARCNEQARQLRDVRSILRMVPAAAAPDELRTRLRVVASHEFARRQAGVTTWTEWNEGIRLWLENMMRPLALPAAGGVLSALLLFGVISPQLVTRNSGEETLDVPTAIFRDPTLTSTPLMGSELEDMDLELTVDNEGRLLDYAISAAQRARIQKTPAVQRSLEQSLLLTRFAPARAFGQATAGKIRLRFRSSSIDVKG